MAFFRSVKISSPTLALTGAFVLTGCMVGPDYERPDLITPDAWHSELKAGLEVSSEGVGPWWESFEDPILDELILRTQRNNLDLRILMARVEAAQAEYGVAGSYLLPSLSADGYSQWFRAEGGEVPVSNLTDDSGRSFKLGGTMNWELDLWGQIRRSMESKEDSLLASIENWRDLLVSVRADVATSYVAYRTLRRIVEIAEVGLVAAEHNFDLTRQSYENGMVTMTEVLSARSLVASLESGLHGYVADAAQELNRISVLVGEAPGSLNELLGEGSQIPVPPASIGVAMPANVVRQRPDVRAAERNLAAAVAGIGVAEADLLPSFSVLGSVGFQSSSAGNLLDWSNRYWSVGPSMSWQLLNWGRVSSQIDLAKAGASERLIIYEKTILGAYRDIEDALVDFSSSELSRRDTEAARNDSLGALVLAEQAYQQGTQNLPVVIETELQLLEQEFSLINAEAQVAFSAVTLYKALGGDWSPVLPSADGPIAVPTNDDSIVSATAGGTS